MIRKGLILLGSLFIATTAHASITYFNSDFESAIDTGSAIVDGSNVLNQVFGDVSLSSFGSLSGNALVFNPNVDSYEQVSLTLGAGAPNYHVEFDLETHNLVGSGYGFAMLADTPQVRNLNVGDCCGNSVSLFGSSSGPVSIGYFTDDTLMHVVADMDLANNLWSVSISGVGSITTTFDSAGGDVNSIRFSLNPALGGVGLDSSVYAAIDNLSVSTVPLPAAFWLFLSGFASLCTSALVTKKTQQT